jgi:hypothetical protein
MQPLVTNEYWTVAVESLQVPLKLMTDDDKRVIIPNVAATKFNTKQTLNMSVIVDKGIGEELLATINTIKPNNTINIRTKTLKDGTKKLVSFTKSE